MFSQARIPGDRTDERQIKLGIAMLEFAPDAFALRAATLARVCCLRGHAAALSYPIGFIPHASAAVSSAPDPAKGSSIRPPGTANGLTIQEPRR